jgi:hypothetical protein
VGQERKKKEDENFADNDYQEDEHTPSGANSVGAAKNGGLRR